MWSFFPLGSPTPLTLPSVNFMAAAPFWEAPGKHETFRRLPPAPSWAACMRSILPRFKGFLLPSSVGFHGCRVADTVVGTAHVDTDCPAHARVDFAHRIGEAFRSPSSRQSIGVGPRSKHHRTRRVEYTGDGDLALRQCFISRGDSHDLPPSESGKITAPPESSNARRTCRQACRSAARRMSWRAAS